MNDLTSLYNARTKDLGIPKFSDENDREHHFRLVYSGLGAWILKLTSDRDIEDPELKQISKLHVTNSAKDILDSFLGLDNDLGIYFNGNTINNLNWKLKLIKNIEDAYLKLGYFESNSKQYSYHEPKDSQFLSMDNGYDLAIDNASSSEQMVGLGRYNPHQETCTSFLDFLPGKANAKEVFETLSNTLSYQPLQDNYPGYLEIYDLKYRKWALFSIPSAKNYPFSLLRIDKLSFAILKTKDSVLSFAKLPEIYNMTLKDPYYYREQWRVLLGRAAYLGKPFQVSIKPHFGNGIEINFRKVNFLSLPGRELALLQARTWPLENCFDSLSMVTYQSFEEPVKRIRQHLSIEIE